MSKRRVCSPEFKREAVAFKEKGADLFSMLMTTAGKAMVAVEISARKVRFVRL